MLIFIITLARNGARGDIYPIYGVDINTQLFPFVIHRNVFFSIDYYSYIY